MVRGEDGEGKGREGGKGKGVERGKGRGLDPLVPLIKIH